MPIVSTKTGYDNKAIKKPSVRPNGQLTFGKEKVNLWIYEVSTGFAMSGTTAQSSRTRSFFAHNFQQPSFTISCQFPSQQHMALAAELVRKSHKALESSLLLQILSRSPVGASNRKLKGVSQPLSVEGYVQTFPRVHERHVYAPDVNFTFVVEKINNPGGWGDSSATVRRLKSWHDIIEGIMAHDPNAGFTNDDDANVNKSPNSPNTAVVIPDIIGDH